MADLWQQNGVLIGVALVLAVLLLLVLLGKGRRKVQIEREETPADTSVKRNQALIDLPPAASGIAPPAIAPQEPAAPIPAPAPAPAPTATAPVAKAAAAVAEPALPHAAVIGADAEPAEPASPQTGSIVAPMPAPDPVHEPAVVVKTAPRTVGEPAAPAALSAAPATAPAAPAAPGAEGEASPAAHVPTPTPPAPASGGSDELTRIKGLGPKLAETLQALGVVSFAQIASWDDSAIDRIDDQLGRFKGRIRRDNWVEQARLLSQGNIAGYEDRFGKI